MTDPRQTRANRIVTDGAQPGDTLVADSRGQFRPSSAPGGGGGGGGVPFEIPGLVLDGVTDNAPVINNWFAAGRMIGLIPAGNVGQFCGVLSPAIIPQGCVLMGQGRPYNNVTGGNPYDGTWIVALPGFVSVPGSGANTSAPVILGQGANDTRGATLQHIGVDGGVTYSTTSVAAGSPGGPHTNAITALNVTATPTPYKPTAPNGNAPGTLCIAHSGPTTVTARIDDGGGTPNAVAGNVLTLTAGTIPFPLCIGWAVTGAGIATGTVITGYTDTTHATLSGAAQNVVGEAVQLTPVSITEWSILTYTDFVAGQFIGIVLRTDNGSTDIVLGVGNKVYYQLDEAHQGAPNAVLVTSTRCTIDDCMIVNGYISALDTTKNANELNVRNTDISNSQGTFPTHARSITTVGGSKTVACATAHPNDQGCKLATTSGAFPTGSNVQITAVVPGVGYTVDTGAVGVHTEVGQLRSGYNFRSFAADMIMGPGRLTHGTKLLAGPGAQIQGGHWTAGSGSAFEPGPNVDLYAGVQIDNLYWDSAQTVAVVRHHVGAGNCIAPGGNFHNGGGGRSDVPVISELDVALTVADGVTNGTAVVTSATAAFTTSRDVGRRVTGTDIPANTYVGIVNSATSIGLSSSPTANVPVNATGSHTGNTLTLSASSGVIVSGSKVAQGTGTPQFTNFIDVATAFDVIEGLIVNRGAFSGALYGAGAPGSAHGVVVDGVKVTDI